MLSPQLKKRLIAASPAELKWYRELCETCGTIKAKELYLKTPFQEPKPAPKISSAKERFMEWAQVQDEPFSTKDAIAALPFSGTMIHRNIKELREAGVLVIAARGSDWRYLIASKCPNGPAKSCREVLIEWIESQKRPFTPAEAIAACKGFKKGTIFHALRELGEDGLIEPPRKTYIPLID